jgi:Ca-activated chloride channel family protein
MSKVGFNELISMIKNQNIKLYTVGIGSGRDYNGRYLNALAKAGKAKAYGASNSDQLNEIYKEIDKLEATKIDNKKIIQYTYLYIYPLLLSLLSLMLFIFIRNRKGA